MALQKRTVKIIAIIAFTLIVIAILLGLLLGFLLNSANNVELEVYPRAADGSKEPLISYKISNNESYFPWVRRINDTLDEYRKIRNASNPNSKKLVDCSVTPAAADKVCDVDINQFWPCTAANQYSYEAGKPCVFLKLNKVPNWVPKPYNTTESLPATMPDDLKRLIKPFSGQPKMNKVWVSCEGVTAEDAENMGPVKYIREQGYPSYFFPYTRQEPYLSPLIAVLFEKPSQGVIINVICKAWAKNIAKEGSEQTAAARFQLKVDN